MTTARTVALTHERLQELLHYDPETGVFTWRVSRGSVEAGAVAGTVKPDGYIHIQIDKRMYKAHRLAWFYVNKVWPLTKIDHSDTITRHNNFYNLREATNEQSARNRNVHKNNKLGIKGVHLIREGKYRAVIQVGAKQEHLGYFNTKEEAAAAYATAAQKYFGEFARV